MILSVLIMYVSFVINIIFFTIGYCDGAVNSDGRVNGDGAVNGDGTVNVLLITVIMMTLVILVLIFIIIFLVLKMQQTKKYVISL